MDTEWGFSEGASSAITSGWGFETDKLTTPAYSELEVQIVNARNRARRIMTTVPEFTTLLAQSGLGIPQNTLLPGLDNSTWAKKIGAGAQFTVFLDTRRPYQDRVIKRVNAFDTYSDHWQKVEDTNFRKQLHTIETEILALCHPPLRNHRNIVTLFEWGYDYREDSNSPAVPILHMERASCSLFSFLTHGGLTKNASVSGDTVGYQLCLDVAEGLTVMHKYGIVHGDIKPDNILIFPQSDSKVPYIAKLSDFGVCVALQGEGAPTDFTAYRGTPGWRPPEAGRYVEEIHGPFAPDLLLRCDSFSYGLLVLSVLGTGGHPPLSKSLGMTDQNSHSLVSYLSSAAPILPREAQKTSSTSEPAADHNQISPNPLDDALAVLDRATHLRKTLRARVRSLLPRVLQTRPENRELINPGMLADDEEDGYLDWWRQKNSQLRLPPKASFSSPAWKQGVKYWIQNADLEPLQELDKQYGNLVEQGESSMFPGEALLGMAISHLSSETRKASHQANIDKALGYVTASALNGFYAAQGICERLHRGLGRTLPASIDEATHSQWLYNAASTGSLLASEILTQSGGNSSSSARSEFRKNGGYNDTHNRTIQMQAKLLGEKSLTDIMTKQDTNNYVVDIQGNRLLHLASMVGDVEVTRTLLSLEDIDVNVRNDAGETSLLLACKAGHARIVELLVDSGADASIIPNDPFSRTALHWLFNFETDEIPNIGRILVQKANASINHRITPLKTKALHGGYQYRYGQIEAFHFPFEWPYGTALHWATFSRSHAAIDILCELGAYVDALDLEFSDFSQTPLSMAANRVDVEMVEHLLKKGACPTKTDQKNRGPLHFLSEDVNSWNRGLLGWRGFRDWILCGDSVEHRLKVDGIVKLLLEAGCDLESTALWGGDFPLTPLAYATGRKLVLDANVTLSLIESGANIDVPLATGSSLLQQWAEVNPGTLIYPDIQPTVLITLISKSSIKVLEHRDPLGRTFLSSIVANPWLSFQTVHQTVEYYGFSGCSLDGLNSRCKNGHIAWHSGLLRYRSKFKQTPLVQLVQALRLWGADLTITSDSNQNALHFLGQNDRLEDLPTLHCLQLFKEKVPVQQFVKMINQQDNYGQAPLMLLAKFAKVECVKWLVEEGADTNLLCKTWNQLNWTALDLVLHEAERYRRWFLVEVHLYHAREIVSHNYLLNAQFQSDDLKENFPTVFQYLRSKGAKRGSELGLMTEDPDEPRAYDKFALDHHGMHIQTPKEWQFVYELKNPPPEEPPTLFKYITSKLFGS